VAIVTRVKGLIGAGVAAVVVAGGVVTAAVVADNPGTQGSPGTAATVPAGLLTPVPALPSPVMTLPGSTTTPVPAPKPSRKPPEPVHAKFKVVRTVTKSNQSSVPVGQRESYTWTLEVLCDPHCAVTHPGGDTKVSGRTWTYSYTSEFTCYRTNSAGKQYDKKKGSNTNKAVLRFNKPSKGKPQTFTGTIKERLKKQCRGYEGEFEPWSVNYQLKGAIKKE
jgi:hypothetical protein